MFEFVHCSCWFSFHLCLFLCSQLYLTANEAMYVQHFTSSKKKKKNKHRYFGKWIFSYISQCVLSVCSRFFFFFFTLLLCSSKMLPLLNSDDFFQIILMSSCSFGVTYRKGMACNHRMIMNIFTWRMKSTNHFVYLTIVHNIVSLFTLIFRAVMNSILCFFSLCYLNINSISVFSLVLQ